MRSSLLVVISLMSLAACNSKNAEPPAASNTTIEKANTTLEKNNTTIEKASIPPVAAISKWSIDAENSSAEFVCKHVMFTNVRGMFHGMTGTVVLDEVTLANSKVNATIQVNTLSTGVEERDTHLKGSDFFDAARFPTFTFVSTSFVKANATSYSVEGNLTMHGITKPVTLAVTASPPFSHAGGTRRAIEATASVNRKDFGLRWEYPGEGPGVVVGDNIKITIDAELVLE